MQKVHFSIHISAPKEKVWNTMLNKETYERWATAFGPTSSYEGTWEQGTEMRFIGTDEENSGQVLGMFSRIKENREYEFISIEHLGFIKNGTIDTTSEEVKKWIPAFENYTFTEATNGTELMVDIDVNEEYKQMFDDMWPKALQQLKALCEK
jgi:uncharacterized protein YndB with AHSA1/START domain